MLPAPGQVLTFASWDNEPATKEMAAWCLKQLELEKE
jgi:hypothetical protein